MNAAGHRGIRRHVEADSGQAAQNSTMRAHLPALDGVRGLAILLVLVAHLTLWGNSTPDQASRFVTLLGFSGVDLFFVLSGFLITRLLWSGREPGGLQRFWIRRILRIWPLYLAALVGLFVVLPVLKGLGQYPMPELWRDRWYYWLHATNIRIAVQGALDLPYNTGHFWSLAVEEQFYLVWPLVVWRIRTPEGLLRVSLAAIVVSWILRLFVGGVLNEPIAAYVLMPTRMDGLALGAMIFALSALGRLDRWRSASLIIAAASSISAAALMPIHREAGWADSTMGVAASLFHAALLTRVLTGSAAMVDRPWLRMFGRYSYGIYVIHFPLLLVLKPLAARARMLPTIAGWSLPTALAFFVGATGLSLVLAIISYHFYERHFLALKDRLAPTPRRDRVAPQAAQSIAGNVLNDPR